MKNEQVQIETAIKEIAVTGTKDCRGVAQLSHFSRYSVVSILVDLLQAGYKTIEHDAVQQALLGVSRLVAHEAGMDQEDPLGSIDQSIVQQDLEAACEKSNKYQVTVYYLSSSPGSIEPLQRSRVYEAMSEQQAIDMAIEEVDGLVMRTTVNPYE